MAEEHGVFGPALIRAELLSRASVLCRHQLLGHRVAVGAGVAVFAPVFRQVMSKEELTAWERRKGMCHITTLKPLQDQSMSKTVRAQQDVHRKPGCRGTVILPSCTGRVSLPSLQKKQSLLLILLASLVIFSVLQYSHRDVTKLAFLNS